MYSRDFPFLASVKERRLLTGPGSQKETWHVVLDLEGSGICYAAGDCVAVIPTNDPELARQTALSLGHPHLEEFLTNHANITLLNQRLMRTFGFKELLSDRKRFKEYVASHTLADLARDLPKVVLNEEEIRKLLPPILPRFYSIASSQCVVGNEVHLTIRCQGVCTDFLCHRVPLNAPVVPLFLQKADTFCLPDDPQIPIIMVGPGTGVAPYRAFLQERTAKDASGLNWLFFGEWTRKNEFFYETFWNELAHKGLLRLDTAFSRDQEYKVYVQHKILEKANEVWRWLEHGAYFYVCGDAKRMARDVDAALHQIAQEQGRLAQSQARDYVRHLRRTKRYLTDVY